MPNPEIETLQDVDSTFVAAIRDDLSERVDAEGRSPLDFLIAQIQNADPDQKALWRRSAPKLAERHRESPPEWWSAFERFVVLCDLQSAELGDALEEVATTPGALAPRARATLYALLDITGKPPSASYIFADEDLKRHERLRWLDLMLSRIPKREDAQTLVLDAVREGSFKLEHFIQRLNEMRRLGGPELSIWLSKFGGALPPEERAHYEGVLDKAFGPLLTSTALYSDSRSPQSRSMREVALSHPHLAALPIGVALRRYSSKAAFPEAGPLLALLQKATSFNQSQLLQHHYLCAYKHERLKESFHQRNRSLDELTSLARDLLNFTNRSFYEAAVANFDFLKAYFSMRSASPPRVCLKGNFRYGDVDTIVSIFRDGAVNYKSDTRIEKNTGFHAIRETGSYFLENDIPRAALEGRYVNPRLESDKIRAHFKIKSRNNISALSSDWKSYWVDSKSADDSSFYKSTLIVPLSLFNNEISAEFKKQFEEEDVERSIWGFLCIDHSDAGFFDEQTDVFAGKIFADILCTYAVVRLIFTDFSNTFRKVIDLLREKQRLPRLETTRHPTFSHHLSQEFEKYMSFPEGSSNPPKLVTTDPMLLRFARGAVAVRKRKTRAKRVTKPS